MKISNQNWGWFRITRLAIGITMLVIGIYKHEVIPAFVGGILMYQALLNTGCASGNCLTQPPNPNPKPENITYEEIK
ncbi:MAG: hypothetical protein MUE96_07105 [Bacteroidia bacterium]|jgi:hypothetical protein|nr:hypothetical protein [Bacteroidia bacterium]